LDRRGREGEDPASALASGRGRKRQANTGPGKGIAWKTAGLVKDLTGWIKGTQFLENPEYHPSGH
jgi:hypothetical protein